MTICERLIEDVSSLRTYLSTDRQFTITAETLVEKFFIGPYLSKAILYETTKISARYDTLPTRRRYCSGCTFNVKSLKGKFATTTL